MIQKKLLTSLPYTLRTLRCLTARALGDGLTVQQYRLLCLISEGMGQTQMAHTLQVSMAAISKMVNQLVNSGHLERAQCVDRRCLQLKLTTQGKKIHKRVTGHIEKAYSMHLANLSNKDISDLEKGLDVLEKLMGMINEK